MAARQNRVAKNRSAPIPDAELAILKALWADGPATVRELRDRLDSEAAYTTVQTLVGRLVERGYVRANRRGHAHVFAATIGPDELAHERVEEVASSLLDGAVAPLVLRLVENGRFSADDIKSFRKLLKVAEERARRKKT